MIALALVACAGSPPVHRQPTERPATVIAPEARAGERLPVVFAFHGRGGRPLNQVAVWEPIARRERFVLVVPHQLSDESWFLNGEPGLPLGEHLDLGIFDDLLARVAAQHSIDPDRVFVSGFSLGGMFTHQLACDRSERLAGIAVVGATLESAQVASCAGGPLPVMHIQGTDDHWDGARMTERGQTGVFVPVSENVAFWSARNGCEPGAMRSIEDRVVDGTRATVQEHTCARAPLRTIGIEGGGHFWPGMPIRTPGASRDFSASEEIWSFFAAVPARGR
jgi:polyhydroxybutyrate depolymerase